MKHLLLLLGVPDIFLQYSKVYTTYGLCYWLTQPKQQTNLSRQVFRSQYMSGTWGRKMSLSDWLYFSTCFEMILVQVPSYHLTVTLVLPVHIMFLYSTSVQKELTGLSFCQCTTLLLVQEGNQRQIIFTYSTADV